MRSRIGRRLGWAFVGIASLGAGIAGTVAVVTLIGQEPIPGVWGLLPFGIPLLLVGQVWAIVTMSAREPPRGGRWLDNVIASGVRRSPRDLFFGDLERVPAYLLLGGAAIGWLLAASAFPFLVHGGPDGSRADCEYVLNNHGSITCVSRAAYQRAGAAEERIAAGVFLAFYCIHVGVAAGALRSAGRSDGEPVR